MILSAYVIATMSTTDPLQWLLRRLREAADVIPDASVADGLEYAMIAADHENDSWEASEMPDQLSKTHSYKFRDPDESWWTFRYGDYVDYTGHHWGWQVHHLMPGATTPQRIGIWKETNVIERLIERGQPLTNEDWDDLRLWLNLQWARDIAANRIESDTLSA